MAVATSYRTGAHMFVGRAFSEFLTKTGQPTSLLAKAQSNLGFASALGCGRVDVTLTPAQIITLNTTPVTLVPAQAGVTAVIEGPIFWRYTAGGTGYTGTGNILIQYHTGAVAASANFPNASLGTASSDQVGVALPNTTTNIVPTIGDSLEIVASAALSTGNGSLRVSFTYLLF